MASVNLDALEKDAKAADAETSALARRAQILALIEECRRLTEDLDRWKKECHGLQRDRDRWKDSHIKTSHEVEVLLAPALGYPPFDDTDPAYQSYNIGEHTPETLAAEAACVILQHKELHD